jgi:hypothetical protein
MQDAVLKTESLLWNWFIKSDALVATGIVMRVARGLLIDNSCSLVPDNTKLSGLLRKIVSPREQRTPIMVFVQHPAAGDEPAFLGLSMRVPELAESDGGSLQNLASLIKFACCLTGAEPRKVKVITDVTLGNKVLIPAFHQKLLNETIVAASHTQGVSTSGVYKIKEGFEANPQEMLGMLRILNNNIRLVRKSDTPKGKTERHLEPSEIREAFNLHMGLKSQGAANWVLFAIKEVLARAVRPMTDGFPGCFVHAAKKRLGASSPLGALQKMGWTPVVPTHVKANVVVYNTTKYKTNGKQELARLPEDSELDYPEHRLMVALCLPKINPNSAVPLADQVRRDPLDHTWSKESLKTFGTPKYRLLVNALTLAHNIFNSVADTKSKAEPAHFSNVRNETLKRSAHVTLRDANGVEYSKFSDLPAHVQGWFKAKYAFKHGSSKRSAPVEPAIDVDMGDTPPQFDISQHDLHAEKIQKTGPSQSVKDPLTANDRRLISQARAAKQKRDKSQRAETRKRVSERLALARREKRDTPSGST